MIAQTRMQTDQQPSERTWSFPRRMVEDYVGFSALLAIGFFLVVAAISFGLDYWSTLDSSSWDGATGSITQWYAAIITGTMVYQFLPAAISNGKTRRDFGIESLIYIGCFSAALALMVVVGFLLEKGLYAVMDWPQTVNESRLYASSTEVHLIFLEHLLRFAVWTAAGYLIGAGFYRSDNAGGAVLAMVWIPVMVFEFVLASGNDAPVALLNLLDRVFDPLNLHPVLAYGIGLAILAFIVGVAWRVIRDISLRTTTE